MTGLVVVALAATRLTRAIQHEQIGEPVRTRIDRWLNRPLPGARRPPSLGPTELSADDLDAMIRRQWIRDMTECDHCFGFWITLGVVVAWKIRPLRPLVEALAAAAVVSAAVDHYPGWGD